MAKEPIRIPVRARTRFVDLPTLVRVSGSPPGKGGNRGGIRSRRRTGDGRAVASRERTRPGLARCVFDTLGAHLSVGGKSARRAAAGVPGEDQGSAEGHRGRTADRPAHRPGHFPRGPHGLLAGPLPLTGIADPALLRASHIIPWPRIARRTRSDSTSTTVCCCRRCGTPPSTTVGGRRFRPF